MIHLVRKVLIYVSTYLFISFTIKRWNQQCLIQKSGVKKFIHGVDRFISDFNHLYRNNIFCDGILGSLLKVRVEKLSGNTNPKYARIVLNLFLALAESEDLNKF